MHNGDYQAALLAFQQLGRSPGATEPEQQAAALGAAEAQLRLGSFSEAEASLVALLERYPAAPETAIATFWLAQTRHEQMDWAGAIEAYQAYLALDPTLTTYVSDLIADAHLALGDTQAAVAAYETALTGAATASKVIDLRERLANAYLAAGQVDAAVAQYNAIRALTDDALTLARMDYLSGYALIVTGRAEEGYPYYLHAVQFYPAAYDSYQALIELVDAGFPIDDFQRGLVDYYAKAYLPAITAFYRHFDADPLNHPADGHLYAARSYEALGNYTSAIAELDVLIETHPGEPLWDDAWLEKAKMYAAAGDVELAVATHLAFVEANPTNGLAPIALWWAAALREGNGSWDSARLLYRRLADEYPANEDAPEALLRAGVMAYWGDQIETAAADWQALATGYPNSEWTPPALVWLMQVLPAEEGAAYRQLAAGLPQTDYYAIRATDIVSGVLPFEPPSNYVWQFDEDGERAEAEAWLRNWLGLDPEADVDALSPALAADPRWERGRRLWELGLAEDGRTELNSLRYDFSSDALASYQLALAFRELGLYRSSILAAHVVIELSPAATELDVPPFIARLCYPAYYLDLVQAAAAERGLDPLLVFSMIRQESLFESIARSWAAAQGLMQVIPSTGEYIARQLNWPNYRNEDLYKPYVSVPFGSDYLAEQLTVFGGDVYVALSAYNAGPGNAARWVQIAPDNPDLYLEVITLGEPRRYIQRIYTHYTIYRALYGTD